MIDVPVKTPCIGVCSTGIGDRVCRGCKRFAHEVIHWNSYSNEQKLLIEERLAGFLSRCVRNKLQVVDKRRLKTQLEAHRITFPKNRDVYCWAYCLLKAGAGQIGDPVEFGILIDAEYRNTDLPALRLAIDDEYFMLSDAYYERYIDSAQTA